MVEELRGSLEKLKRVQAGVAGEDSHRKISLIIDDFENKLQVNEHDFQALIEEMEAWIESFEARHPTLTSLMAEVVRTLSNVGI